MAMEENKPKAWQIQIPEKIEIIVRFCKESKEEVKWNTTFEGWPVGRWIEQIRSEYNKNPAASSLSMEQIKILNSYGLLNIPKRNSVDDNINQLIGWSSKYPNATVSTTVSDEILREYAETEEEYSSILMKYKEMQTIYSYIKNMHRSKRLTDEQISKCREGNVRGVFGYPTPIGILALKTGQPRQNIGYIIANYGTIKNFVDLIYGRDKEAENKEKRLKPRDIELAKSMIRTVFDIDLNPAGEGYDNLYNDIISTRKVYRGFYLYSSEMLKKEIAKLNPRSRNLIEKKYGLKRGEKAKLYEEIADEEQELEEKIQNEIRMILQQLRDPKHIRNIQCPIHKREFWQDEESGIIENLQDMLYESGLIFKNSPHITRSNIRDKRILEIFGLIKEKNEARITAYQSEKSRTKREKKTQITKREDNPQITKQEDKKMSKSKAQIEFDKLTKQITEISQQLRELRAEGKKNSEQYKELSKKGIRLMDLRDKYQQMLNKTVPTMEDYIR